MPFNLAEYEEVKDRIPRFWADHRHGSILTELVSATETDYIVKAVLKDATGRVIATGLAQERIGATPVNKTSALENCETSAIGRALANAGYASGANRPSREEMSKPASVNGTDGEAGPSRGGGPRQATQKQRQMIERLVNERGLVPETWPLEDNLTMKDASALIDTLQAEPKEPAAERRSTMRDVPVGEDTF